VLGGWAPNNHTPLSGVNLKALNAFDPVEMDSVRANRSIWRERGQSQRALIAHFRRDSAPALIQRSMADNHRAAEVRLDRC
jgi:hypothetical protein